MQEYEIVVRTRYDSMNEAWHVEINQVFVAAFRSKPEAEQTAGFIQACVTSLLTTRDAELVTLRTAISDLRHIFMLEDGESPDEEVTIDDVIQEARALVTREGTCDAEIARLRDLVAKADERVEQAYASNAEAAVAEERDACHMVCETYAVGLLPDQRRTAHECARRILSRSPVRSKPETSREPRVTPEDLQNLDDMAADAVTLDQRAAARRARFGIAQPAATLEVCGRCGAPYMATGYCSRRDEGCQGGRGEAMLPHPEVSRPEGEEDENWGRVRCSMYEAGHKQGLLDAAKELLAKLKPPFYVDGVLCCMFCKRPIDEDDCRTCGGQGICTETLDSGDMSGTCPECNGNGTGLIAGSK